MRVPNTDTHHQALLGADDGHDATQVAYKRIKQFRCQFQFHELVSKISLDFLGALVVVAVLFDRLQRAVVQTTDDLEACFYFFRIRPCVDNLFLIIVVIVVRFLVRRFDFVRGVWVDEANQQVLHAGLARQHGIGDQNQRVDRWREMRHVVLDLVEAVFDALGNFNFALARQQLNRAHLAHVHAHRVGRAAEFSIHAGQCRFGLFNGFVVGSGGIGQDQ